MKDYHDLYLKCDVLLLANVLEKFRYNSLKNYGLCPSLRWDNILKWPKLSLNLLQILAFIFSLIKVQEVKFFSFRLDNLIIDIW